MVYTIRPPRIPLRKKNKPTTTSQEVSTTTVGPSNATVPTLRNRFRFATRKPYLRPTANVSTTQASLEDQELGNAGKIAVALQGLSTAPLPRAPVVTTPIPKLHRISTTVFPKSTKNHRILLKTTPQASNSAKNILNNVIPQKNNANEYSLSKITSRPAETVPQRTTQYFPTYGKFPQSTRSELTFFQSTTPTSLTTQDFNRSPSSTNIVTTSHREVTASHREVSTPHRDVPTQIYRVTSNTPQVVDKGSSQMIQDYTGLSTIPPEITRPIQILPQRQYSQYRISTQSPPVTRPTDIQKTLEYPTKISSAPPQILSRPLEINPTPERDVYSRLNTNQHHITSRPTVIEDLPPPRGLTPEEFARLSPPPSHLITRTSGIQPEPTNSNRGQHITLIARPVEQESESTRSLTTPERSQHITLIARPVSGQEYDYYDSGVLSQLPPNSKVLVLPSGAFQCLDRGNFPHPESCKKFISCYEGGVGEGIIGWEYTCPRGLSFDPVGGICNWSAGLGCKQLD